MTDTSCGGDASRISYIGLARAPPLCYAQPLRSWGSELLLLHAVDRPAPFVNRDHHTRTAVAVQDPVRFRKAVAFQELTPPVRLRRSPFGNLPQLGLTLGLNDTEDTYVKLKP